VLLALLIQIVTLLPPTPAPSSAEDLHYRAAIQTLAATQTWTDQQILALVAKTEPQRFALSLLIQNGSDWEVRLAAVLSAGVASDSTLGRALWRRAALDFQEARCLACLLAPATPANEALPLLAWIARDHRRTLPVRAAAIARLLDADCLSAWPTAYLMLLAGTAADANTVVADWPRSGRYELPKRILFLAVQDLLARHHLEKTNFEPNAAWQIQVQQLAALHEVIQNCTTDCSELPAPATWKTLLKLKKAGSDHAAASFELFRNHAALFLTVPAQR
jgi:hypothetical protein